MTAAPKLLTYLEGKGVDFRLVHHRHTASSMRTAELAHVPGDRLAKGVVFKDKDGYVIAVAPATHQVLRDALNRALGRDLDFASEEEFARLFPDCQVGAVPPLAEAYGQEVVVDDSLRDCPEVFLEAGDHEQLIQVDGQAFERLFSNARRAHFTHHA